MIDPLDASKGRETDAHCLEALLVRPRGINADRRLTHLNEGIEHETLLGFCGRVCVGHIE